MPGHDNTALIETVLFTSEPVFTLNPDGLAPLAGVVQFCTNIPTTAQIVVCDGVNRWLVPTDDYYGNKHRHVILGLKADREHSIQVKALGDNGEWIENLLPIAFKTEPLPDDLPFIDVRISDQERMEPGYTFFGIRKSHLMGARDYGYLVAVDTEGEVVWHRKTGHTVGDIKRLKNGNLIYLSFDNRAIELDMLGNVVNQWYAARRWPDAHSGEADAIPVDAETFHHEIFEMENGNFLVLSVEVRELENYPSSENNLDAPIETANVVGDVVIEFNRQGDVVSRLNLLDILDPYRIGYGCISDYWIRKGIPNSRDWSHTNGVVHDASDDTLILSVRHQDAVVKIKRDSGELVWILGNHEGWREPWSKFLLESKGDLQWQYHQHNSNLTERGTVILFDNGNYRAMPGRPKLPAADNFSRAVEFDIDEENMTVTQVTLRVNSASIFQHSPRVR